MCWGLGAPTCLPLFHTTFISKFQSIYLWERNAVKDILYCQWYLFIQWYCFWPIFFPVQQILQSSKKKGPNTYSSKLCCLVMLLTERCCKRTWIQQSYFLKFILDEMNQSIILRTNHIGKSLVSVNVSETAFLCHHIQFMLFHVWKVAIYETWILNHHLLLWYKERFK